MSHPSMKIWLVPPSAVRKFSAISVSSASEDRASLATLGYAKNRDRKGAKKLWIFALCKATQYINPFKVRAYKRMAVCTWRLKAHILRTILYQKPIVEMTVQGNELPNIEPRSLFRIWQQKNIGATLRISKYILPTFCPTFLPSLLGGKMSAICDMHITRFACLPSAAKDSFIPII